MFSSIQRRPIKFKCDAPAYEIVKASGRAGMRSPEDVRWRRQSAPKADASKRKSLLSRIWQLLFAFDVPEVQETCGCGNPLPQRRCVELRKRSGSAIRYALGQCGRCRTIVWDAERCSEKASAADRSTHGAK